MQGSGVGGGDLDGGGLAGVTGPDHDRGRGERSIAQQGEGGCTIEAVRDRREAGDGLARHTFSERGEQIHEERGTVDEGAGLLGGSQLATDPWGPGQTGERLGIAQVRDRPVEEATPEIRAVVERRLRLARQLDGDGAGETIGDELGRVDVVEGGTLPVDGDGRARPRWRQR